MQAAIRNTRSTKDLKHMEKGTRLPVNQGWLKMEGGSKKVKSQVGATVGNHSQQQRYSTKISEKCPDRGSKAVGGYRTRGKKRGQYTPRKYESTSVLNRAMGGAGFQRGGHKQTWDVNGIPSGHTDLSQKKYSVQWLCHRGISKSVQICKFELPEVLNKQRLTPRSYKRRYPFVTRSVQIPSRRTMSTSKFKECLENIDREPKFEENKQQYCEKFTPVKIGVDDGKVLAREAVGKTKAFSFRHRANGSSEKFRGSVSAKADPGCTSPSTSQRVLRKQPEKDTLGVMTNKNSIVDNQNAYTVFKAASANGSRQTAGPISRPQPEKMSEEEQRQRFSNSKLQGDELAQLTQMLNEKLGRCSVAPQDLVIVSKSAAKNLRISLKTLGYECVTLPPNPNDKRLTMNEKTKLSYQHEVRKLYNYSRVQATKQAGKYQRTEGKEGKK